MDQLVVFVSYSHEDGLDFALKLRDWLRKISPPVEPWIDYDHPGHSTEEVFKNIGVCDVFLFVVTRSSPHRPRCLDEINLAQEIGAHLISLRIQDDAELPPETRRWTCIDFTKNSRKGWAQLRDALKLIGAPEAKIQPVDQKISVLEKEEPNASGIDRQRVQNELAELRQQKQVLQRRVIDPQGAIRQVEEEISRGQEKERAGESASAGLPGMRCVHEPPASLPGKFWDRTTVIESIEKHLRDRAIRLVVVIGQNGNGKTAMIRRLRDSLWAHRRRFPVRAFVYLAYYNSISIRPTALLDGLAQVIVQPAAAKRLGERLIDPALTLRDKLDEILEELTGTTVVVLDDAEALLGTDGLIRDPELGELVGALLSRSDNKVKLILVTSVAPREPVLDHPVRVKRIELDGGLPADDACAFLRELDSDGTLGLRSAPADQLQRAYQLTGGHPRALEQLYVILRNELGTCSLSELLDGIEQLPSISEKAIMDYLIGRSFGRIGSVERRLIQVLAAYGQPVRSSAVTYVLNRYVPGYPTEETLRRLAGMRLIRHDGDRFFVPPTPDGEWVLDSIPVGSSGHHDGDSPPLTLFALRHYAAEYFANARQRRVACVDDLSAQLAEIRLRMLAHEYRPAFELMSAIDGQYLSRWGHSDAIAKQREDLKGNLGDKSLEADNLIDLAAARRQQDDQQGAIAALNEALRSAGELPATTRIRLQICLASAHRDHGQVSRAQAYYREALTGLRKHGNPLWTAQASEGLCLCLAETGQFDPALAHLEEALRILRAREGTEARWCEAHLLLTCGWVNEQLGRNQDALETIQKGHELASQLGEQLLEGYLLGAQAEVLISDCLWGQAIKLAKNAADIGARAHDVRLSLAANQTLAVALLCGDDIGGAYAAADHAARYRHSPKAMGALAVQGLVAFRTGEQEKARLAFHEARTQAEEFRERDDRNYRVLDILGLALCGLAVCGDRGQLEPAVRRYREARAVSDALGAVRRSLLLLDKLTEGCDPAMYAEVRRTASGPW